MELDKFKMDNTETPNYENTLFELGKFQMHSENILEELEEIHHGKSMQSSKFNSQILINGMDRKKKRLEMQNQLAQKSK